MDTEEMKRLIKTYEGLAGDLRGIETELQEGGYRPSVHPFTYDGVDSAEELIAHFLEPYVEAAVNSAVASLKTRMSEIQAKIAEIATQQEAA